MDTVSLEFVKKLNLHNQKLHNKKVLSKKEGMEQTLNDLGCIQLDALNIVTRCHNLFFFSRVEDYQQDWFYQLYEEKKVFEGYTKALCLFPIENYKYITPLKKMFYDKYFKEEKDIDFIFDIYNEIKSRGPLSSRNFENSGGLTGSWEMSPIRWALNFLWRSGLIEVVRDNKFEKIYDLVENVIPSEHLKVDNISIEDTIDFLIETALANMGAATLKEISSFAKIKKNNCLIGINRLIYSKRILPLKVEGVDEVHYILSKDFKDKEEIEQLNIINRTILSPFDNLIWDRERIFKLFNIDYRLEAYVPSFQRKYGYYAMPILINTEIVGVIDLKYTKGLGKLETKKLTLFNQWRNRDIKEFQDILDSLEDFLNKNLLETTISKR